MIYGRSSAFNAKASVMSKVVRVAVEGGSRLLCLSRHQVTSSSPKKDPGPRMQLVWLPGCRYVLCTWPLTMNTIWRTGFPSLIICSRANTPKMSHTESHMQLYYVSIRMQKYTHHKHKRSLKNQKQNWLDWQKLECGVNPFVSMQSLLPRSTASIWKFKRS